MFVNKKVFVFCLLFIIISLVHLTKGLSFVHYSGSQKWYFAGNWFLKWCQGQRSCLQRNWKSTSSSSSWSRTRLQARGTERPSLMKQEHSASQQGWKQFVQAQRASSTAVRHRGKAGEACVGSKVGTQKQRAGMNCVPLWMCCYRYPRWMF